VDLKDFAVKWKWRLAVSADVPNNNNSLYFYSAFLGTQSALN